MPRRSARIPSGWSRPTAGLALSAVLLAILPWLTELQQSPEAEPRQVDDPAVVEGLAWHLDQIGAPRAWRSGLGAGTVVAVIDSGVDVTHPDLHHQVRESVSCIGAAGDPGRCQVELPGTGAETHGTHVAGLIAARADDHIGVAGVAPRAELLVVRTLQTSCPTEHDCRLTGDTDDVAAGVRWATSAGADVINLSLNTPRLGEELRGALDEAWDAGVVPVLAAGPRTSAAGFFDYSSAVLVTATDRSGHLADHAPFLDAGSPGLAAPGGSDGDTPESCRVGGAPMGLLSTAARTEGDRSGYACLSGTSMAAAVVSGSLAVLLSMGYEAEAALDRLADTARPGSGLGAGAVDLAAATAGPHRGGVTSEAQSFNTGAPRAQVTGATTGPFRGAASAEADGRPTWLILVLAGLAVLVVGDMVLRVRARRRGESRLHPGPTDDVA